jgi:AcrR family transcriptional regulator
LARTRPQYRLIDIARRVGSSPATFYQYFKDVRDVVLFLATEVSGSVPDLVRVIDGD